MSSSLLRNLLSIYELNFLIVHDSFPDKLLVNWSSNRNLKFSLYERVIVKLKDFGLSFTRYLLVLYKCLFRIRDVLTIRFYRSERTKKGVVCVLLEYLLNCRVPVGRNKNHLFFVLPL